MSLYEHLTGAGLDDIAESFGGKGISGGNLHRAFVGMGMSAQKPVPPESDKENTDRDFIPIRNTSAMETAREHLLDELRKVTIPRLGKPTKITTNTMGYKTVTNRPDVIGSIGRTITFGYGMRKFRGFGEFVANGKFPEVFKALVKYGNTIAPRGWKYSTITLNHGVKAKKHKDTFNVGRSIIVGIGDYTGGRVKVWDKDDKNPIEADIHDKPLMFNGAKLFHQTTPFKGERYTLIYYNQKPGATVGDMQMVGRGDESSGGVFA